MKEIIVKILLGNYKPYFQKPRPAISKQVENVKKVWNNTKYNDFGIERIVRLFLVSAQFLFPALYIRHFFGKIAFLYRKLGVELYVIIKVVLPIVFFKFHLTGNTLILIFTIYMLVETILYLLGLIFLSDIYTEPTTYKRSLLKDHYYCCL